MTAPDLPNPLGRWLCTEQTDDGRVHVLPLGDQVEHERTDECVCGPKTELVTRDDGPDGWVVIHYALDRRHR